MKKFIIIVAVCLLSVSLFAQTGDVLSLEDAIALYEDDEAKTRDGDRIIELIKELVSKGIHARADGGSWDRNYTSLMYASFYGYTEIVKSLMASGADIEAAGGYDGETALMSAAQGGQAEAVKILIEAGADVHAKSGYSGSSAFMNAARSHTEVIKILIDAGADVNAQDEDGNTALKWAAQGGHAEGLKLLIEAGANIDRKDNTGHDASGGDTALMWAAYGGHTEAVKVLIKAGADVNSTANFGETALTMATRNGNQDIINLLTAAVQLTYTVIQGTGHNYYEVPYAGVSSVLTEKIADATDKLIEKYNFPTTVNDFLDDGSSITGKLASVYHEDIPNENGDTALSIYRLMYALSTGGSKGMTKLSFIEGEGTERQSYGQAIYILNIVETYAELFNRDIYFGNQDLSGTDSLSGVIGNNTYFKVINDTVISVLYTLQSSTDKKDSSHEAIIYRNNIEDIQDKTELCKVDAPFPLIDKNNPYRYTIQNALDGNPATSYVEDTEDDLMSIQFEFIKDYTFTDIAIINGYAQAENLYYVNNRCKSISFPEISTDYEHSYNLDGNTLAYQEFTFENSITQSFATIDVTEIYDGTKYSDTCLAELDIYIEDEGWLFGLK